MNQARKGQGADTGNPGHFASVDGSRSSAGQVFGGDSSMLMRTGKRTSTINPDFVIHDITDGVSTVGQEVSDGRSTFGKVEMADDSMPVSVVTFSGPGMNLEVTSIGEFPHIKRVEWNSGRGEASATLPHFEHPANARKYKILDSTTRVIGSDGEKVTTQKWSSGQEVENHEVGNTRFQKITNPDGSHQTIRFNDNVPVAVTVDTENLFYSSGVSPDTVDVGVPEDRFSIVAYHGRAILGMRNRIQDKIEYPSDMKGQQ